MNNKEVNIVEEIKSLQSAFYTLKVGVENSCKILKDFVNSGKSSMEITKEDNAFFVSLILLDSMICEDVGKSIMDYFDFKNDNLVIKTCQDDEKCFQYLDFLSSYINYRIEHPIDVGEC